MDEVELRLPADVAYVGLARLVVATAARLSGMDDGRAEDLKIAVSEATANAIKAHEQTDRHEPVVLKFGAHHGSFEVVIQDAGPGFDPEPVRVPTTRDWESEGGLGLTLIQNLADDVQFSRERGMRVHLSFTVRLDRFSA